MKESLFLEERITFSALKKSLGLVQVYTGKGKGKTTAALGLGLRAVGQGFKVLMVQFIKGKWHYGELEALKKLFPEFKIVQMGKGAVENKGIKKLDEDDRNQIRHAFDYAKMMIFSNKYDIVILDEINNCMAKGFLSIKEVIELIKRKPKNVELILTGRNAPKEIIEIADLVTEMVMVKHPYLKGIKARKGIEF